MKRKMKGIGRGDEKEEEKEKEIVYWNKLTIDGAVSMRNKLKYMKEMEGNES